MHPLIRVGEISITFLKTRHETHGVLDLFEMTIPPSDHMVVSHLHRDYDENRHRPQRHHYLDHRRNRSQTPPRRTTPYPPRRRSHLRQSPQIHRARHVHPHPRPHWPRILPGPRLRHQRRRPIRSGRHRLHHDPLRRSPRKYLIKHSSYAYSLAEILSRCLVDLTSWIKRLTHR